MRFPKSVVAAVLLATYSTNAFVFKTNHNSVCVIREQEVTDSKFALHVTPQDLTDTLAKAHEEKIRAMKDIEDKKNAEIQVSCGVGCLVIIFRVKF